MKELMVLEKEQDHFLNEIIETKGGNLPARIEDVLSVFEFTDFKAKAWKVMSDKLSRLEDQSEAYHSALRSGQHWGIAALYAQKRMGEITREIPKGKSIGLAGGGAVPSGSPTKPDVLFEKGITRRSYSDAERIAAHPEILDRVIEHAKERGEIPTKTAVLNTIRVERDKKDHEIQKKKYEDSVDQHRDRAVADYFEAIKGYKAALDFARIAAERGKFAPESKHLLLKKHSEIRSLMYKLEESV